MAHLGDGLLHELVDHTLGMLMAIERNVSWGRRLVAPLGIVLLAAGLLILGLGMGG